MTTDSKALAAHGAAEAKAKGISLATLWRIGSKVIALIMAITEGQPTSDTETVNIHGTKYDVTISVKQHVG